MRFFFSYNVLQSEQFILSLTCYNQTNKKELGEKEAVYVI